jgi:hypothetical protein
MDAAGFEHGMNPRTPIDLTMIQEDLLNVGGQAGIFSAMVARLSVLPGIVAADRDLKRLAEHRNRVLVAVLSNERKDQGWVREKMPSASDKISLKTS